MDAILTSIVNSGVSVTVSAAFIYLVWHFVTKTLPETRKEYLISIEKLHADCAKERTEQHTLHERVYGKLAEAVNHLSDEVKGLSSHHQAISRSKEGIIKTPEYKSHP